MVFCFSLQHQICTPLFTIKPIKSLIVNYTQHCSGNPYVGVCCSQFHNSLIIILLIIFMTFGTFN